MACRDDRLVPKMSTITALSKTIRLVARAIARVLGWFAGLWRSFRFWLLITAAVIVCWWPILSSPIDRPR